MKKRILSLMVAFVMIIGFQTYTLALTESDIESYQGIFMKDNIFLSIPLYTDWEPGSTAVGVVYQINTPTVDGYGYVNGDFIDTLGELHKQSNKNYYIQGDSGEYGIIFREKSISIYNINGSTDSYIGDYIQISNAGANMNPSSIWFNIPTDSTNTQSPSDWAKSDIEKAIELGLIPEELQTDWQTPITRVDFCKLAWNLYIKMIVECDAKIVETNIKFPDTIGLPNDDEAIISTIAALGIVSGYEDNTFRPYNEITREEAAVMLARTVSCFSKDSTNNYPIIFGDISDISDWAKDSVDLVSAIGIMSGVQVSDYILNFQPKGTYTREQAMVTFYRLYNILTRIETLQEKFPDKKDLYTLETVPEIKINGLDANFGNYHGMYIDNYSVLDKKDKSFDVSFDVYNTAYIYGIVEVYDKNDNWIEAVPIKKMSDNGTSIKGSLWDNSIDLINDIMNKNLLTYRQASGCSKKTSIKVNIPYGGYIKITNNAVESPLLAIMNITDISFSTYKLVDSLTNYDNSTSEKYMDKLTKEALKNEYFVNLIKSVELKDKFNEELFKGIAKDINISNESAGDRISTILQNIDNLDLTSLIIDSAESIGLSTAESTFEAFAGPAGVAMKGLFFGTKAANTAIETKHYFDTVFSTDSIMIQNLGQGLTGTSMGGR